jgi:cytochrome c5
MSNFLRILIALIIAAVATACGKNSAEKVESPQPSAGELVYTKNCKVCHAQGINGAPMLGNKTMWQPRVEKGIPTLVEHAGNGFGLMPAKGGNADLTTEEIESAVRYMVAKVQ